MTELPQHIISLRQAKIREHQAKASGILHLGAHTGQERKTYSSLGKPVIWVEANPHVFQSLRENIKSLPNQSALCALLGSVDGGQQDFHISNNFGGASSSVFPFGEYATGEKSLWPELDLKMVTTITLPSVRLDTLLSDNAVDAQSYDFWVLDLQGSEMLALAGAESSLRHCSFLLAEVSRMEVYRGAPVYEDLQGHLAAAGFFPAWDPYLPHDDVLFVK
jgi:FkbM family methyltransferase